MEFVKDHPRLRGKKLLRMMKLTAAILLATCLQVSAKGYSQKVTLNLDHVSLEKVFKDIKKQTGFLFLYQAEAVKKAGKVSVNVENASIEEVMKASLSKAPFTFKIVDRTIILSPAPDKIPESIAAAPSFDLRGKVTDENGVPLVGASINVRGTNNGTSTNAQGEFALRNVEANAVLEISFVGYNSKTITVHSSEPLQIVLSVASNKLDEMVVIAYGTTSKRLNTGSVSSVTSETISRQPVADPLGALQGRAAGLMITSNSGMPGSSFKVRVRGENSIKQGNEPLYIIDGVPYISSPLNQFDGSNGQQSPLSSINPNDIERIDVLKDADATAIYGSRGANGVLLITTKKGKAGEGKVDINYYTGISKVSHKLDMLNTEQYLAMRQKAFDLDGNSPTTDNAPDLLTWDQKANTDWQDLLIGHTAHVNEAQVSFSGGTAQTSYLISGTFHQESTVLGNDLGYKRGGVHMSTTHRSKDGRFGLNGSLIYSTDKNNSIPTDVTQYFYLPPNYPVYNPDGSLYWFGNVQNPLAFLKRGYETNTDNLIGNSVIHYDIMRGLVVRANLGFTQTNMDQIQTLPEAGFNPDTYPGSSSQFGHTSIKSYILEPQAEFTRRAGPGQLNILAGASWQHSVSSGNHLLASGFSSDNLLKDPYSAANISIAGSQYSLYNYQSVFGRVRYNVDQKYLLNMNFRRDGSSRFGPGKRFGNFASVGAGWIFSNENFLKNKTTWLSYGKLRASYGSTGNDQIGDYQYLDSWGSVSFPYGGISGLYPESVYNPDYSWEVNKKMEVGLELDFWKDRVLLTVDYYNNRSSNQLIGQTLSSQTGFTSYIANLPAKVENSGWELDLNTINIQSNRFSWSSSINLSIPKNVLLDYPDLENSSDAASYEIGQSIRVVKGFHFTGIDPQTGIPQFLDVNKDNSISDPDDYVVIGQTMPAFFGGFSNDFQYGKWSLSFLLQFVKQEAPTVEYGPLVSNFGSMSNKPAFMQDYWTAPGSNAAYPVPTASSTTTAYKAYRDLWRYSDAAWGEASYLRLKNLSLGYDLSSFASRWHIHALSLYAQAQNLFTLTNYKGLDPEVSGFDRRYVYPINPFGSVKPQALPVLRTITLGFRMTL